MSERTRTRDLLLQYDKINIPPKPQAVSLESVYPWENLSLSILSKQLFTLALKSGFNETEADFYEKFGSFLQNKNTIFMNFIDFPDIGENNKLYFALDEKVLYYWDNEYIPVNTMLIADTIINGGEA